MRPLVLLACTLLLPPDSALRIEEATPNPWATERYQWTEAIGSRNRLVLENEHGDLRTRDAGDDKVEVVANLQTHTADVLDPRIDISEIDGGLKISVVYEAKESPEDAAPDGEPSWPADPTRIRGRVDVTVLVPAGVDVEARTLAGLLELKGVDGAIDARSESGDVVVSTARAVRVVAEQGAMRVLFKGTDWSTASELRTGNGELAVWLPPDAGVAVAGETSGLISTDFSLRIEHDELTRRKRALATIGDGGAELRIHSATGPISILRSH